MEARISVKSIRAYLSIEADTLITFHTGKITKTLLYSLVKELSLYRGIKGMVSPVHLSPLFKPSSKEWELGDLVTPYYEAAGNNERLVPVELGKEYIIHIGGITSLIEKAQKYLERLRTPLQVKIDEVVVTAKLENIMDVTKHIEEKQIKKDKATIYIKAPSKLFNVYTTSKLPKFSISAFEILITPYMFLEGEFTITEPLTLRAFKLLGRMIETWYSLNTIKSMLIPYNGRKTPVMTGKITYILEDAERYGEEFNKILNTAEIVGIGQSRQNGFGTISWKQK